METKLRGFEVCKGFEELGLKLPQRATKNSAGYDFRAASDITIPPTFKEYFQSINGITSSFNKPILVPTGIRAYMQPNEVLIIANRSGGPMKRNLVLANSIGVIDCVPAGTMIATPQGQKNIVDIFESKQKEIIFSYNEEENCIEQDVVTECWIVNDLPLLEIKIEGNVVQVPKHKEFYTKRGWIQAKDLKLDDEVLLLD